MWEMSFKEREREMPMRVRSSREIERVTPDREKGERERESFRGRERHLLQEEFSYRRNIQTCD